MKLYAFANRNFKEVLRDPLTLIFSVGFPIILLALMSAINAGIPAEANMTLFEINKLAPAVVIFGLSFITLNLGLLIAKDRSTSFLMRLYASPLKGFEYILGYILPQIVLAIAEILICYIFAIIIGLDITVHLLSAIVIAIPAAVLFIALGILLGCCVPEKAVGGLSSLIVNLAAWLSGIWFDVSMVGGNGIFKTICDILPFIHAVNLSRNFMAGNYANCGIDIIVVLAYTIVLIIAAIFIFQKKMKSDAK